MTTFTPQDCPMCKHRLEEGLPRCSTHRFGAEYNYTDSRTPEERANEPKSVMTTASISPTDRFIEEKMKKFDAFIGTPPETLRDLEDKSCFVCGQPFDKAPQIIKLQAMFRQALTEAWEGGVEEERYRKIGFVPSNLADSIAEDALQAYRERLLERINRLIIEEEPYNNGLLKLKALLEDTKEDIKTSQINFPDGTGPFGAGQPGPTTT